MSWSTLLLYFLFPVPRQKNTRLITDRLIFFPNGLTPKLKQQFKQEKLKKKQQQMSSKQQRHQQQQRGQHQFSHGNISSSRHYPQHGHGFGAISAGAESENINNDIEDIRSKDHHHHQQQHHFDNRGGGGGDDYMETGDDVYPAHRHSANANAGGPETNANADAGQKEEEVEDEEDGEDAEDYDDYDDRIRAEIYSSYPHYLHPPAWGCTDNCLS